MNTRSDLLAPRARKDGLVVRELEEETLVFDRRENTAHALNHTAGLVWRHCDGSNTIADIASILRESDAPGASEDTVWTSLFELGKLGLLEEQISRPAGTVTRRQLLVAAGAAALVTTLAVPTGFAHASCIGSGGTCVSGVCCPGFTCCSGTNVCLVPNGQACTMGTQCCSGHCGSNGKCTA